jgi:hypothetical protein
MTKKEINRIITDGSKDNKPEVLERIKKTWNENEEEILKALTALTGIMLRTDKINCEINPYDKNGYYGEDNITIGIYDKDESTLQVITHELIHILYWRKIKELKLTESTLGNETTWEWSLAEFTVYLIQKEPEMMKFWQSELIPLYSEVEKVAKLVEKFWEGKNFEEYLTKSYSLLQNEFAK